MMDEFEYLDRLFESYGGGVESMGDGWRVLFWWGCILFENKGDGWTWQALDGGGLVSYSMVPEWDLRRSADSALESLVGG